MGYTHYWKRNKEIEYETFKKIVNDFKKILPEIEKIGIPLGNADGENEPIINYNKVSFNGLSECGHSHSRRLFMPWPEDTAGGVAESCDYRNLEYQRWVGRSFIDTRCCNGDCSYQGFVFERIMPTNYKKKDYDGKYFDSCMTAFRPYDLVVNVFLVIAKHYLKNNIIISSDGEEQHWYDGKYLCQMKLDYGLEIAVNSE